jgi:hypothetical protein
MLSSTKVNHFYDKFAPQLMMPPECALLLQRMALGDRLVDDELPAQIMTPSECALCIGCPVHPHRHLTQSLRFTVRHLRWVPPIFDGGTEADLGPDGNRTIQVLSVQSTSQ